MPQTPHVEKHFQSSDSVRDVVIGMADGLTVPFALAAGLSAGLANTQDATTIILTAGGAEIVAGAIAMGLGGYLAAKTDAEHYEAELKREHDEIVNLPEREAEEIREIFREYEIEDQHIEPIIQKLQQKPDKYADFMMKYELGLEKPDPKRGLKSALTIALSYAFGGMVPLLPYFFMPTPKEALGISVILTLIVLFIFGFIKGKFTGAKMWKSGLETMLVGGLAAGAAFFLATILS